MFFNMNNQKSKIKKPRQSSKRQKILAILSAVKSRKNAGIGDSKEEEHKRRSILWTYFNSPRRVVPMVNHLAND